LIIFIENAFKHSKNTADEHIYIEIALKIWANSILFSIKNSHGPAPEEGNLINKNSGFGLASVRKRLELLYPNEHDLKIEEKDNFYHVMMQIKMK
jgi:LytS/YehU family sensor histidine kinase